MAIEQIELELIQDNPYQARSTYHRQDIDDLAHSIKTHGLLQVPPGRRKDGNIELGFGHLRKRAFLKLAKKDPEKWGKMPIDIRDLSDEQMALFTLEENLKRRDITPLEIARAVDRYLNSFLEKTEVELAESLNMTKGNVSNMRRVLRLPEKILEKIDEGRITFTQGRELIILEKLDNSEELMLTAIRGIRTEGRPYGHANTVEGMQVSVHDVVGNHCRPLDKQWEGYRWDILFDTRAAGCLDCEKMIRTHPTKSVTAHWCLDETCWERHQEEHREKAATEAKARIEAEVINRAAQMIAQEEKAPPPAPVMIDENTVLVDQETFAKVEASYSGDRISEGAPVRRPVEFEGKLYVATASGMGKVEAYQLAARGQFIGEERTYTVPKGRESEEYYESLRNDPNGFYHGMVVKRGKEEHVLVGPEVTFVTKVDEGDFSVEIPASCQDCPTLNGCIGSAVWQAYKGNPACPNRGIKPRRAATISQEIPATADRAPKKGQRPVVVDEGGTVKPLPCDSCAEGASCDRSYFHIATDGSGQLVCEEKVEVAKETLKIPLSDSQEAILALAREKAGTRAEVLDLKDIGAGYYQEVKQGYALLDGVDRALEHIIDPEECLERCTHGFHFAFDSRQHESRTRYVCTDTKCLTKKKAAYTRVQNAEGQARKKAEVKAVKEAIAQTTILDRARIKLILLAQMDGLHASRTYYYGTEGGTKNPEKWLWEKLSAGTPEIERNRYDLFKRIDKLTDEELAKLVVEFMFYYLTDKGDIGTYEIKVTEPLKWMGIDIQIGQKEENV